MAVAGDGGVAVDSNGLCALVLAVETAIEM
jgi:hypothetical protein